MIDIGNGKFNLLLLIWGELQGSPIHDHSNSECFIKVIAGKITEKLYPWPNQNGLKQQMIPLSEETSTQGQVTHMNSKFFSL